MATASPSGSHLSGLAARRAGLQKSRERLGMAPSGGVGDARPQAQVEAPAPVPPSPASPEIQPSTTATRPNTQGQTARDPAMLDQARGFMDQVRAGGQESAPAPGGVLTPPPAVPASLNDQIAQTGGMGLSPYAQAQRVYGRTPTAREFAIFSTVKSLESELGRPPTRNELLMRVTAPGGRNASGPEPVAGM